MEDLASPVGAFVRDNCKIGPDEKIERDVLYTRYRQWCEESGFKPSSKPVFGRDLRAARPQIKVSRPWAGGAAHRPFHYVGITVGRHGDCYDCDGDQGAAVTAVTVTEHCTANKEKQPEPPIVSTGDKHCNEAIEQQHLDMIFGGEVPELEDENQPEGFNENGPEDDLDIPAYLDRRRPARSAEGRARRGEGDE
jgi:hypothetical protein